MSKYLVFPRQDGKVSVLAPCSPLRQGETEADRLARVAAKAVRDGIVPDVAYTTVEAADLPADRYFRDAWEVGVQGVTVNLDKARGIHKANLLRERDKKLAGLRDQLEAAEDRGDVVTELQLRARRADLRNLDNLDLNSLTTADAIKGFVPAVLARQDG
jgi:hypothetical protein